MKRHKNNRKHKKKDNKNRQNIQLNTKKEIKAVVTTSNRSSLGNEQKQDQHRVIVVNKNRNRVDNNKETDKQNSQMEQKQKKVIIDSRNLKSNKRKICDRSIIPYKINTFSTEICPLCNKPITDMSIAILQKTTEKHCHFDCVLADLRKKFILKQNQRLSYIGSGIFAIIEDVRLDGKVKFVIKERINYSK